MWLGAGDAPSMYSLRRFFNMGTWPFTCCLFPKPMLAWRVLPRAVLLWRELGLCDWGCLLPIPFILRPVWCSKTRHLPPTLFTLIGFVRTRSIANRALMSTAPRSSLQFPLFHPRFAGLGTPPGYGGHRVDWGIIHSRGNASALLSPPRRRAGARILRAAHLKGDIGGRDVVVSARHHAGALG